MLAGSVAAAGAVCGGVVIVRGIVDVAGAAAGFGGGTLRGTAGARKSLSGTPGFTALPATALVAMTAVPPPRVVAGLGVSAITGAGLGSAAGNLLVA